MKRTLIAGLLVWAPLGITIWVLHFLVTTLDQTLSLLPGAWHPDRLLGYHVPGLGVLLSFVILLVTGAIAANFFGAHLIRFWEGMLGRIPVVKSIYSSVKQVSDTLFSSSGEAFRKAVLVQWPREGMWTIAFLTGVPGVNQPANVVGSEMIRLNTALPVTPKGSQNSLGAAACFVNGALVLSNPGCDPAGFPNGRRPGDDVVDIELRVAMGYLLPPGAGKPGSANLPYTDGVLVEDSQFDSHFPFLATPFPGSPNGVNGIDPGGN